MSKVSAADWLSNNFCDYKFSDDVQANAEILKQLNARLSGLGQDAYLDAVIAFFSERGELQEHDGIMDMKLKQTQNKELES